MQNLTEDREGNLWVGTSGGGLNRVQPRTVHIEGHETGLPFEAVQALCETPDGRLFGVTQEGLVVRRTDGRWHNAFSVADGFNAEASCIAADASGAVWIGTRNHRLYCWRDGRLSSWGSTEGLRAPLIRTLLPTKQGDLWIGGGRPAALQRFRDGTFQDFAMPSGIDSVWTLVEDPSAHVWIGGSNGSLLQVTAQGEMRNETALTDAPASTIRALHATPDGTVWISYEEGGGGRLKAGGFRRITSREGLGADQLRLILSDRQGWLWFVAVTAVFKVRQSELDDVAEGRAPRVHPVRFGREQGLHVILGGAVGAIASRDSRLWLPLATSLAIFYPARQRHDPTPPPVLLTRLTVDEEVLGSYGGLLPAPQGEKLDRVALRLRPDHRRIEFNFTAPSFTAPENVRFRYRLEGIDDRWIEAGARRNASYSRLPAAGYRFRVLACNSDGVWNDAGATLAFSVAPFWWETWWFRGAMFTLFTGGVFASTRYISFRRLQQRLRAAERQAAIEGERARIARDIHDDLGGRLTKIVLLSGLAARNHTEADVAAGRMREISETARQLIKSLDETVWTVDPTNDTLPHLVSYVGQLAANFLQSAEIACRLELPDQPPPIPVGAEIRHNLILALKEALTNVVRHAKAREVRLRVELGATALVFTLEDNGIGFTPGSAVNGADGLGNMRQRMEKIGGTFVLESQPGRGTRISFQIPRHVAARF